MTEDQTTAGEARQGSPRIGDRVRAKSFANPGIEVEGSFFGHSSDFVSHVECDDRAQPCPVLRATIRPVDTAPTSEETK